MSTTVTVVGTIATDPRTTTSPGRASFCSFRLASTDRRFDRERNSWVDGETNWFSVNAFRSLAEHAGASFAKGERVIVHGRLRIRSWESDEKSGTSVEIEAEAIGHDLRWGVTAFTRQTASEPDSAMSQHSFAESTDDAPPPQGWPEETADAQTRESLDTHDGAETPSADGGPLPAAA